MRQRPGLRFLAVNWPERIGTARAADGLIPDWIHRSISPGSTTAVRGAGSVSITEWTDPDTHVS